MARTAPIDSAGSPVGASPLVAGHIREFDGLRGLAILAVLAHHFWPTSGWLAEWSKLPHLGWIGVDLFFVISACLITGILLDTRGRPGAMRNFYARRVIRIFPLYYLVVIGGFLVIPRLQGSTEFVEQSGSAWWYLLYLGNLRESLTGHEPAYILAVTWSLCIEEQFYLAFPILVCLLSPARLRTVLWSMVIAAPLFRLVTTLAWPENERVQYLATPSRVDVLALGCLIALGVRGHAWLPSRSTTRVLLPVALASCAVAFLAGGLDRTTFFGRTVGYSLVAVASFAFVLWALQRRETLATAWLRTRPLCTLGVLCYGIYLLQRPAQVLTGKLLAWLVPSFEVIGTGWGLLIFSAAAVVAAAVSWFAFERPILALKRFFVTAPTSDSATPEPRERPAFTIEIDARLAEPRRPSRFVTRSMTQWMDRTVARLRR
jgi:peptidoglycan/LPS O-acetylase OafA/YrhL